MIEPNLKIYLDCCCIQRPLDTKNQLRIVLEAEAVLGLIELCRQGDVGLVSSDALRFEIGKCPNEIRREYGNDVLKLATVDVEVSEALRDRAVELEAGGLKPLDSLHVASAEVAGADYFCTCDDGILNKARNASLTNVRVLSPVDLIREGNL